MQFDTAVYGRYIFCFGVVSYQNSAIDRFDVTDDITTVNVDTAKHLVYQIERR